MQFSLRTLILVTMLGGPLLAFLWYEGTRVLLLLGLYGPRIALTILSFWFAGWIVYMGLKQMKL